MPTTVTASNGDVFHLWQLGDLSAPEPEDGHSFTTIDNTMSHGHRSSQLLGLPSGKRSWRLELPTLAASSVIAAAVTDPYSATVSRETYVRNCYRYNKSTGKPIAYQWPPSTGNYYLVDFVNEPLTLQKKKGVGIFSTVIEFKQRRIQNVSVFNPSLVPSLDTYTPILWLKGSGYTDGSESWTPSSSGGYAPAGSGDVNKVSAAQNGQDIVRFSNTTNDGVVTDASISFKEVFLAMKMREATFSNNAGIITDTGGAGTQVLTGASGTALFTNPGLSTTNFEYRYNGEAKAQSAMTAPMNAWGIVHLRYTTGYTLANGIQIGKNRTTAGTFAELDLGEAIFFTSALPVITAREVTEYLATRWGIDI